MVGYTGWAGDLEHCWTHNAPFCGGKFLVISFVGRDCLGGVYRRCGVTVHRGSAYCCFMIVIISLYYSLCTILLSCVLSHCRWLSDRRIRLEASLGLTPNLDDGREPRNIIAFLTDLSCNPLYFQPRAFKYFWLYWSTFSHVET